MEIVFRFLIFTQLIFSVLALRNKYGCKDREGETTWEKAPECATMLSPSVPCPGSSATPPFTVRAEQEGDVVKVSMGNDDYGESLPISMSAMAAEDPKKPGIKFGNFEDLNGLNDGEITYWCCNKATERSMVGIGKGLEAAAERLSFNWLPGDYKGDVHFVATIKSGNDCFKHIFSNALKI